MSEYSRLIRETTPKARKNYHCDACELICIDISHGHDLEGKFTPEEKEAWENAKNEELKIKIGAVYLNQTLEFDGMIYSFKARPEIWEICKKYRVGFDD